MRSASAAAASFSECRCRHSSSALRRASSRAASRHSARPASASASRASHSAARPPSIPRLPLPPAAVETGRRRATPAPGGALRDARYRRDVAPAALRAAGELGAAGGGGTAPRRHGNRVRPRRGGSAPPADRAGPRGTGARVALSFASEPLPAGAGAPEGAVGAGAAGGEASRQRLGDGKRPGGVRARAASASRCACREPAVPGAALLQRVSVRLTSNRVNFQLLESVSCAYPSVFRRSYRVMINSSSRKALGLCSAPRWPARRSARAPQRNGRAEGRRCGTSREGSGGRGAPLQVRAVRAALPAGRWHRAPRQPGRSLASAVPPLCFLPSVCWSFHPSCCVLVAARILPRPIPSLPPTPALKCSFRPFFWPPFQIPLPLAFLLSSAISLCWRCPRALLAHLCFSWVPVCTWLEGQNCSSERLYVLFSFVVREEALRCRRGIFNGGREGTLGGWGWKKREKPRER